MVLTHFATLNIVRFLYCVVLSFHFMVPSRVFVVLSFHFVVLSRIFVVLTIHFVELSRALCGVKSFRIV